MIVQPLRQQQIPDVISLMALGGPYITARTSSDYWLYATLFSSTCLVAVVDSQLVGVVIGFRSQDDSNELYIQDVMVHPNYQRQGVVRRLLNELLGRAKVMDCRRVYLTSDPGNRAAHEAWIALGFRNVSGDGVVDGISVITDFKGQGKTRAIYEYSPTSAAMSDRVVREKVLCYIVRDGKLLVFRHTDYSWEEVGVQVPAGSIRAGETPEDAALREAREETGLSDFSIRSKLGEAEYDISPYRLEIQHRHFFELELHEQAPERWTSQEDHDGQGEPTKFECFWIPLRSAHILQSGQGALLGRLIC
ncbi:GNAT family N-acetyltransferase [Nocardia nepalensis]|uniref:GNAT family N-acetyltransferase n=1 Tax=Nocardia nepalensis TaxID=3375448 RepID=UPI003B67548A